MFEKAKLVKDDAQVVVNNKEDIMRKIVEDIGGEGLDKLLGERVVLFCANYFYTGTLIGVNTTCVLLRDPAIIYETGPFTGNSWKDCQSLGVLEAYVMTRFIESYWVKK
jgi:hypothetical protein